LIQQDLWQLELGSTILFFHRQTHDWTDALQKGCDYKKVRADYPKSQAALELAQRVHLYATR
jgi:nucleotidyltransferase/DNA polymerase involved in DNA repair